jgi:DNA ligase-1
MKLREFAEQLVELETTRSRLVMVEHVARLLARAAADERAAIVYMLQAQLRPPFEGLEIGLGEKLLVQVLTAAYDTTEILAGRKLRALGDLGRVAEELAPAQGRAQLSVRRAYDTLLDIAQTSGAGSVARRIARMVALLNSVGALEAKALVRIAQGRLRLGLGDQTILEAAALAALGDRRQKSVIEHAYNVRSDLGDVVALAFAKNANALQRIGPQVGVPVRPALAQRLPSAQAIIARLGPVHVEPKYDGFRLQLHRDGERVWIFSRRLENVTHMFPDIAHALRRQLKSKRAILEGEAIAYDPVTSEFLPFQITMTRKRKTRIAELSARYPLRVFTFDLLLEGKHNLLPEPLHTRSRCLRRIVQGGTGAALTVTEFTQVTTAGELQDYFDTMIARGLEGVVAKRVDAPYNPGARGYDWVKLKRAYQSQLRDTVDLILVGYLRGRGKRSSLGIGSLVAACYDARRDRFRTVAKIGSGLSDKDWKTLRTLLDADALRTKPPRVDSLIEADVWSEPRYVVEVLADEITRSPFHTCGKIGQEPGYGLRFPRLVGGIRSDKSVADGTTEQEILEMYRQQRARPSASHPASAAKKRRGKQPA